MNKLDKAIEKAEKAIHGETKHEDTTITLLLDDSSKFVITIYDEAEVNFEHIKQEA